MLRLFFIFIFVTFVIHAKLNLEVVVEHNGSEHTVQSRDIVFSGDSIKFYFSSDDEVDFDIFIMNKGTKEKLHSQKLEEDTSYSFPPSDGWMKLDENIGLETFVFKLNGKTVKIFELNHIPPNLSLVEYKKIKDLNATTTVLDIDFSPIENRIIDPSKIKSNARGATSKRVFKSLSDATVIIRTGEEIGTGVIIADKEGDILTNWHVVKENKTVMIAFKSRNGSNPSLGTYYNAKVVKIDKVKDLALLKLVDTEIINDKNIKPILFSDMKNIVQGEDVYTMGHPMGYWYKSGNDEVTSVQNNKTWNVKGIKHQVKHIIMTDIPISSGNSGGALVNENLELFGIITYSDTRGQNLNFAVSVVDIKDFLGQKTVHKLNKETMTTDSVKEASLNIENKKMNIIDTTRVKDTKGNPMIIQRADTNNNGIADILLFDITNDGRCNRIGYDKNEDGEIEKWSNC